MVVTYQRAFKLGEKDEIREINNVKFGVFEDESVVSVGLEGVVEVQLDES